MMNFTPYPADWIVLVVDDERDNLDVIAESLEFFGVETVRSARSGFEALTILERLTPTFVLMDIAMPDMDGWETFTRIRALERFKHLPIIALSAHAMQKDKDRAQEFGFDGYITKPVNIPTLLQDITSVLDSIKRKGEAL
jgi:CheY-like chemotaxis protein